MSDPRPDVLEFLERYGEALGAGDLESIVDCWGIPALVLSDRGLQPVTASKEVEAFFEAAVARHRSRGLVSTRPEVERVEPISRTLLSVDVRWSNLDAEGIEKSSVGWRYVLRAPGDGRPRIHVAVMKSDGG